VSGQIQNMRKDDDEHSAICSNIASLVCDGRLKLMHYVLYSTK